MYGYSWNMATYGSASGAGGTTSEGGFGSGYHGWVSYETTHPGENHTSRGIEPYTETRTHWVFIPIPRQDASPVVAAVSRLNATGGVQYSWEEALGATRRPSPAGPPRYFEGIRVYDSTIGDLEGGGGITFPGLGILISEEYYENRPSKDRLDLLRHEFGHILQARRYGNAFYYSVIGLVSPVSALTSPSHQASWTEKEANTLSYIYFNFPADWNFDKYQIDVEYMKGVIKSDHFKSFPLN
jgi:hypothetical protein